MGEYSRVLAATSMERWFGPLAHLCGARGVGAVGPVRLTRRQCAAPPRTSYPLPPPQHYQALATAPENADILRMHSPAKRACNAEPGSSLFSLSPHSFLKLPRQAC